jgi:hypothetical protein
MANSTYLLGGTSESGAYYFYALRRDDEGNLYIRRDDVSNDTNSLDVFGPNKPDEFDGEFIDFDFDAGRNEDHTLLYTSDEVKYEQWFWDNKLASFYLDEDDGQLVAAFGRENKWLNNSENISYNSDSTPTIFEMSLYGSNKNVNLYEKLVFAGWNKVDPVEVTNEGLIYGSSAEVAALTISGIYPYGITLINNGTIKGAHGYALSVDEYGDPGNGIEVNSVCDINNTGTIASGIAATGFPTGYAIVGIDSVDQLTNSGQIGSTI